MESNFKNDTNELIHKTETDSKMSKPKLQLPKGKCGREGWIGKLRWTIHATIYKIPDPSVTKTYYTAQGNPFNTL